MGMIIIFLDALKVVVLSLRFCLPFFIQPLSLGFFLLISSFLITGLLVFFISSWFGIVLFLIYVGAVLVIFSYILVLIPNIYSFSFKVFFFFSFLFFLFFLMQL